MKVEYDIKQVCKYYNRDGGFCTFEFEIENGVDKKVPTLAIPRNLKRIKSPKYDPKYYCQTRGESYGSLTSETVEQQKKCSEYIPRRP